MRRVGGGAALRRRDVLSLVAAPALLSSRVQAQGLPLVGFLSGASPDTYRLNAREIDLAFDAILRAKAEGLYGATDPILLDRREQFLSFAARERLPAVYFVRQFAAAGGLLSYGPSITWMYVQAGRYIGQILKGTQPAEMPVLQPTQFETVLNLKTAAALGLTVAPTDEVIE
jgi:putative tryptophan/tyrosine transport system substrate-binding protein